MTGSLLLFPSLWPKRSARMRKIRDNRARILRYVRANLGGLAVANNGASNDQALSRRASADNLVTLFIAGFETTAATTAWALMALAARQNDQTKLRTEILANSADPETFARYINSTNNNLHSFATEVLRCHPSVPFILRRVERDTTLSVDGAAISLSTGNYVLLSIDEYNKNLDPMGKRFEPFDSARAYDTNSLLTFGGGQKICPGRHLATTEIKLIVALILSRASLHASERRGGTIVRNRVAAIPDCGAAMTVRIFDEQNSSTRVERSD